METDDTINMALHCSHVHTFPHLLTSNDIFAKRARNKSTEKILGFNWDSNSRLSEY